MSRRHPDEIDNDTIQEVLDKEQDPFYTDAEYRAHIDELLALDSFGVTYSVGGYRSCANAIYGRTLNACDQDNRLVAALPALDLSPDGLEKKYSQEPKLDVEMIRKMDPALRQRCLSIIRDLRVYLPFEKEMELEFSRCLNESYHLRHLTYRVENGIKVPILTGDVGDSANNGMTILGYSGCGKSTSLKHLLKNYPQVIKHNIDGNVFSQIVYIVVSCVSNSNFRSLYAGIGKAIDLALHTSIYEKMIDKQYDLGKRQNVVIDLIERFGIGAIILDEIQLINFDSVSQSSFGSLMTITNRTKVVFAVVGLQNAYETMFSKYQFSRRLGSPINASMYCENNDYCRMILKKLWKFQLTDHPVKLTSDIADTFLAETHGIVGQMVNLFIAVQDECISKGFTITPELITAVSENRFSAIRRHLKHIEDPLEQLALDKIQRESALRDIMEGEERQNATIEAMLMRDRQSDHHALIEATTDAFLSTTTFAENRIRTACKVVLDREGDVDWDCNEFKQKVRDELFAKKSKGHKKRAALQTAPNADLTDILFDQ